MVCVSHWNPFLTPCSAVRLVRRQEVLVLYQAEGGLPGTGCGHGESAMRARHAKRLLPDLQTWPVGFQHSLHRGYGGNIYIYTYIYTYIVSFFANACSIEQAIGPEPTTTTMTTPSPLKCDAVCETPDGEKQTCASRVQYAAAHKFAHAADSCNQAGAPGLYLASTGHGCL